MQSANKPLIRIRRAGKTRCAAFFGLLAGVALFTGCATGGKVTQEPVDNPSAVSEKTTISRLKDGREGFTIREPITMDPQVRSDFNRAVALVQNGDYGRAIELFEEVSVHLPGLTAPHVNVAMAYQQTERPELAEEHLKAALELVPGHPVASNEYGLLLRRAGRFEEARNIYERSLERFPEYLPVRKNLGILCDLYLGDPSCALQHYQIYRKARPEDEDIKIWIADLRLRSGNRP